MTEDTFFIERCITRYGAMIKLLLTRERRGLVMRLLAEAEHRLVVANELHPQLT